MISSLFEGPSGGHTAKLKVSSLSDLVILHPNITNFSENDEILEEPTSDTMLEGIVTLTLPTAKKCKGIQVQLISKQNAYVKGRYETSEILNRSIELDTGTQTLGPGEHKFHFSFIVPADSAPHEHCAYGRVYQRIIATAYDVGKLGSNLVAEDNIVFVTNHSNTGGIPPGFDMQREIHQDALGPVGINLHSKYLLVAGYLRLTLILPSIATPIRIDDVFVQVEQTFELRSSKDPSASEKHQQTIRLLSLKGRKGVTGVYQPGNVLSISEQFRVADDAKIRPSTADASKAGIRVKHRLAVCIHYTPLTNNPTGETKELKIAVPATFSSCCCVFEALQLPAYTRNGKAFAQLDTTAVGWCSECLCKIADNCVDLDQYSIDAEEVKLAGEHREPASPFKTDEEFGHDIVSRCSRAETESRTPTPPPYDGCSDGQRL